MGVTVDDFPPVFETDSEGTIKIKDLPEVKSRPPRPKKPPAAPEPKA